MSYESAIADLKELLRRELFSIDPGEYRARVAGESDRASMILNGAMVERFLVMELQARMTAINKEERDRIFNFERPCGSFSNRIRIAQALGVVDRKTRRQLDLVRELRNVAAHAHPDISFATPQIRNAVIALVGPAKRKVAKAMPPTVLRKVYEGVCSVLNLIVAGDQTQADIEAIFSGVADLAERQASLDLRRTLNFPNHFLHRGYPKYSDSA